MIKKEDLWLVVLRDKGHTPVLAHGMLDITAHNMGGHNGPKCSTCGVVWCWHCHNGENMNIERCKGGTV